MNEPAIDSINAVLTDCDILSDTVHIVKVIIDGGSMFISFENHAHSVLISTDFQSLSIGSFDRVEADSDKARDLYVVILFVAMLLFPDSECVDQFDSSIRKTETSNGASTFLLS